MSRRKASTGRRIIAGGALALSLLFPWDVYAEGEGGAEEGLLERVERLEEIVGGEAVSREPEHRLHPVHSLFGIRVSLGLTVTAQGFENLDNGEGGGALAISGDLSLESPVGKNGSAAMVLDFQRGEGLTAFPPLFTGPNGSPTGTNADIESFNNDQVHLTQLYYEHALSLGDHGLTLTVGQLDPTGYFDTNEFANSERTHFLANIFVNNPAVEFGGSSDFYGPGVRASYSPSGMVEFTLGVFEGDGDFEDAFDSPFVMAEADFKLSPYGRTGNYRVYFWNRQGREDVASTANPADPGLLDAENKGVGVSLDQGITETLSLWMRAGVQREKVARFDRSVAAGAHLSGALFGRPLDHLGLGYGATLMGDEYREFLKSSDPSFEERAEHYMEVYYSLSVAGATDVRGLRVSPDIQYIVNPGGDGDAGDIFVYGVRLQASF